MTCEVDICQTILQKADLESGLEEVFTSVSYTVFCRYAADIYLFGIKELEDLTKRLFCCIDTVETRVLFFCPVTSLVKGQLFAGIWLQILMDVSAACACHAVGRPNAALLLER